MPIFSTSSEMQKCIDDCLHCYKTCLQTAMNHCLETGGNHLEAQHFRLLMNCAEICRTAADMMLGNSPVHTYVCAACAYVCDACAASCERVGDMEDCAAACLICAQSCHAMAGSVPHQQPPMRYGPGTSVSH
jgi:hypothetical protein